MPFENVVYKKTAMNRAALGFRVHSGWTAVVAVAGPADSPVALDRRRIQLVKTFTYTFRQPYHTAEKMPRRDAAEFINAVRAESRSLAASGIRAAQRELENLKYRVTGCALLLSSARELPELGKILCSHALIHTADGELFRDAIRHACAKGKLSVVAIRERELFEVASKSLRLPPAVLKKRLAPLGKSLGPPWSQDEKLAALAAWRTLAG